MMFEFYFENYSRVSAYLLASVLDGVHMLVPTVVLHYAGGQ